MKRTIIGLFFSGLLLINSLFLINTFLISMVHASVTLAYYDGRARCGFFYPLNESVTFDVPTENLTSPGPYPYVFTVNQPFHAYLQIRHFLWAYNENYSNHLTIRIDNESVLEAYSPRATPPNDWYPRGDGVQLVDLGMRSAGTHFMTMACNISDYYMIDWWKILLMPLTVSILSPRSITYSSSSIPLTFTIDRPFSWIGYSVDNHLNITIAGNTTINNLSDGAHQLVVYASDIDGKTWRSNNAYFLVSKLTEVHNVTVASIATWKTVVGQGFKCKINVTVVNDGTFQETLGGCLFAKNASTYVIGNQTVINMPNGTSNIITFTWDTTGIPYGIYTLKANATLVPGETDIGGSILSEGTVKVTIPGDVNGDFFVNIKDLTPIQQYWMQYAPPAPANADVNGDGIINMKDCTQVALHWLKHA